MARPYQKPTSRRVRNGYRKWHHDLVLLASDASRLDAFVQRELQPILDGSRLASATRGSGPCSSASGASGGGGSGGSGSAAAVGGASGGVTRVSTLAFDLGDLTSLESNAARLTAAAGASSVARAAAAVAGSGGGGGGGGLLAAAPAAYSHVLLIHNAGQVGDLLPLEHQSLANMRRQTDLNVTSFTYLTAAVLRAFLPGHVDDSPDAAAPLRAATAAAQPDAPSPSPPASTTSSPSSSPSAPGPSGCPDAFNSQTSESTGTSSDTCSPQEASDASASPPQHGHTGVRRRRRLITVVNISSVSVDQPYEHFSLYGMGKAARHMIVRSIAHEADLRERGDGAAAAAAGNGSGAEAAESYKAAAEEEEEEEDAGPWARVRALSYAPGAIDTEMQASAREALPPGRLKSAFEANQRAGRLVDPTATSRVLYDILSNLDPYGNLGPQHYGVPYSNGFHLDYYTAVTGGRAAHPLASSAAASDAADAAESAQEPPAGIAEEAGPGQTAAEDILRTRDIAIAIWSNGSNPDWGKALDGPYRFYRHAPFSVPLIGLTANASFLPANESDSAPGARAPESWVLIPAQADGTPLPPDQQEGGGSVALSLFLAARAATPASRWLFLGVDSSIPGVHALAEMLEGWDSELPYVVTDCLVAARHRGASGEGTGNVGSASAAGQAAAAVSGGADGGGPQCSVSAPRCLPCHLASGGNASGIPAGSPPPGCPCTPLLACRAALGRGGDAAAGAAGPGQDPDPEVQACVAGATHRHFIAPRGGVAVSRGLLTRLRAMEDAAVLGMLRAVANASHTPHAPKAGFVLLSRLLWELGHAVTSPLVLAPGSNRLWSTSAFGRIPLAHPQTPEGQQGQAQAGDGPYEPASGLTLERFGVDNQLNRCPAPLCTADFKRIVSSSSSREERPVDSYILEVLIAGRLCASNWEHAHASTQAMQQRLSEAGGSPRGFYTPTACGAAFPGGCPLPEVCPQGTNCIVPAAGMYNWSAEGQAFYSYMNAYWKGFTDSTVNNWEMKRRTMCLHTDAPGYWWAGQWQPGAQGPQDCAWHRLPRRTIVEFLTGKKVWFHGDSQTRQIFFRLVGYIRGQEGVMEHYYHRPAVLSYYYNDTDSFQVDDGNARLDLTSDLAPGERFRIMFMWEPQTITADLILSGTPPDILLIGGLQQRTWGPDAGNGTREAIEGLVHRLAASGPRPRPLHVFWNMWADGDTYTAERQDHISVEAREYGKRARELYGRIKHVASNFNFQILPYDTMSGAPSPYVRNEEELGAHFRGGLHYACSAQAEFPMAMRTFKTPPNLDCRDGFDLQLSLLLLNSAMRYEQLRGPGAEGGR
ncbi:hypothetical protein HYH03_009592 [Edaphochlamys debaryana]|uniref:Uncharacterized protein n=1 Tax=Edaphochlamys debaryana TaxID=47281 RepID=A0A836BX25_9CHLO|nr:hypothetical protein HYH03_009592 [Edaphochlamys debaryana]|eukprot:KAG2492100.1 hypothetical protein HYH03_009592 [Edaphochlamys debaryana]